MSPPFPAAQAIKGLPTTVAGRWIYALKPASWPKLLVPTLLGQALGVTVVAGFSWMACALGVAFTLALGAAIVWLNDWADQPVDRIKRAMFPTGGSPKTIPDGILSARAVGLAGALAAGLALALAGLGGHLLGRPWLGLAALLCLACFVAYSLPPLRLNYRGGGEALEALGVGLLLPGFQAYLQAGETWGAVYPYLVGHGLLALASALASGLSDEDSDRGGGKRTFTTSWGNARVRRAVQRCVSLAALAWLVAALAQPTQARWPGLLAAVVLLALMEWPRRLSPQAVTGAFAAQGRYKAALHGVSWSATAALALALLLQGRG